MTSTNRKAFTLVELLVVITIIAMLAGLLLPAVMSARARARRTQCENNQHELSVAIMQYETAQGHLPGYINEFGSVNHELSWPVVMLKYLGRNDLWERWRDDNVTLAEKLDPTDKPHFAAPTVGTFVCPADSDAGTGGLSYVVNCGLEDSGSTPPDSPSNGVFHDRFNFSGPDVMSERIPDGAAHTLLLSENIQARRWYDITEAEIGMVWAEYTGGPPPTTRSPDPPAGWFGINQDLESTTTDIGHARPSSHHRGGAVVTYCDGHQGFLDEQEIDYLIYARQMAPKDADAPLPP